ncbi:MAG: hypothetical protein AAF927_15920 [Bacteroidota bacterium]
MLSEFFPYHTEKALWLETERMDLPNQALWALFDEVGTAGLTEQLYLLACREKLALLQERVEEVRKQLGVKHKHPLFLTLQQMSLQILQEMQAGQETISTILFSQSAGRVEIMHQLRQHLYTICFLIEEWRILLQKSLGTLLQSYYN